MNRKHAFWAAAIGVFFLPSLRAQDAKFGTDSLKSSRDFYSKVHMVAIASFSFDASDETEFKYDRYPKGGPERIQSGDGEFARTNGKTWLKSDDWGETGKPADATTSRRLNNWVGLVDERLNAAPVLEFVAKKDAGERGEIVFQEGNPDGTESPRYVFGKFKNEKTDELPLLSEFSGPMKLGPHDATVKIRFSHLVSVKITNVTEATEPATPAPGVSKNEDRGTAAAPVVDLLDGKLRIDVPSDFTREPDDPKDPKTLAKFSRDDGAWGQVLRGTHGLTPDELDGYLKKRVAEYSKGFDWLPKDSHLQWLRKEIVTIDGRKWADWRYVPILKKAKDYQHSPVYTRFLTTSYKGQLLEITFTTNLNTEPELKAEIDHIMDSVHLEE